jgi:hypothetical protein
VHASDVHHQIFGDSRCPALFISETLTVAQTLWRTRCGRPQGGTSRLYKPVIAAEARRICLTNDFRIYFSEFPSPVAASSKG